MKKDNRISPTLAMRLAAAYGLRDTARGGGKRPPYVPYGEDGNWTRRASRVVWASAWHRWKD